MEFHTWVLPRATTLRHQNCTSCTVSLALLGNCGWESVKEVLGLAVVPPGKLVGNLLLL